MVEVVTHIKATSLTREDKMMILIDLKEVNHNQYAVEEPLTHFGRPIIVMSRLRLHPKTPVPNVGSSRGESSHKIKRQPKLIERMEMVAVVTMVVIQMMLQSNN